LEVKPSVLQAGMHGAAQVDDVLQQRIHRILDKLSEARTRGLACFGSEKHGFRLNPPLDEADLRRFETAHGIELPADYRAFLQHAGNGGAGPYYGIYPLDMWNDFVGCVLDEVPPGDVLSRTSPLRPGFNDGLDTASDAGVLSACQGTLSIGTQGCAYATQVIVTSPLRGRVAYMDSDHFRPPYVVRDHDFLAWYERWLDELLGGYETSWFGFGPGGGEAEFIAIINGDQADDEPKGEAAWAFSRLPRLSDAAAAQVTAYIRHPLAEVRAGACAAVRKFEIRSGVDMVAALIGDPEASVRKEAVRTLMQLEPDRWADAVRDAVHRETDENAASSALFRLKESGKLAQSDLRRLIESSTQEGIRASAVYHLDWDALGSGDRDLATRLLNDPSRTVRNYAVLGLRQSRHPPETPMLIDLLEREQDPVIIHLLLESLCERADPAAAPVLLKLARAGDDFHRLKALEGLIRIGDGRAMEIATGMLEENRRPSRRVGSGSQTHTDTIGTLVSRMLQESRR
jgi:HEAT repeat protein